MRRITLWLFSTIAALVLLFSYRTSTDSGAGTATAATLPATGATTSPTRTATPSPSATGDSADSSGSSGSSSGSKTYDGSVAQTRWGPVQVSITVVDGRITEVSVPVYPNENHKDQEINAFALPVLQQATLDAQSADIDTVSGATVTSDGYRESLQAALDAAHLS